MGARLASASLLVLLITACGGGAPGADPTARSTAAVGDPAAATSTRPPTVVPSPTATPTPTPAHTPTAVPAPTVTPTPTPTAVPAPTVTPTPTAVPAPTVTPTPTAAPAPPASPIATATEEPRPAERVASTASIPTAELPRLEFVRADGHAVSLAVEIPPRSEYGIGLSGRHELDERGMLFHYPEGTSMTGFYMRNTHIDLSIAFVGLSDRVIAVREMEAESLEIVRPGDAYRFAIEAPSGWYAEHGIGEGALLRLPSDIVLPE